MSRRYLIGINLLLLLATWGPPPGWAQVERASFGAANGQLADPAIRIQFSFGRPLAGTVSNDSLQVQVGSVWPEQLVQTAIDEGVAAPPTVGVFALGHCTPNPFNPVTTIPYSTGEAGPVKLVVYGVDGRLVRTLVDGQREAGGHAVQWNGRDGDGAPAVSGIYFCTLRAHGHTATRRMVLLK